MARGCMYLIVNGEKRRVHGGNRRHILDYTKWHKNASYGELKERYRWLKEDDKVEVYCVINRK